MAFLIASAILLILVILASILVKASFRSNLEEDKPLSIIRITEVVVSVVGAILILFLVKDNLIKYTLATSLIVGMLLTRNVTAHLFRNIFKSKNTAYDFEKLRDSNSLNIVKKYEVSKISSKKGIYFFSGLLIALVFTTLLIEYKTETIFRKVIEPIVVLDNDDIIDIPVMDIPPPPPPQPKVTIEIKEVPDETLIEEPEIEIEPEEEIIEEREYVEVEPEEEIVEEDNSIFELFQLQQQPEFPGGMGAVLSYIGNNFKMSSRDAEEGNKGRIIVQFVVEKSGAIGSVKVVRGINSRLDNEAIRVIKSMPKWKPGMNAGAPVRVRYAVPVNIQ